MLRIVFNEPNDFSKKFPMFSHVDVEFLKNIKKPYNENDIYNLIYNFKPLSKEEKIIEIAKLYNISYNFMLFDPIANPEVMEKGNIKNFAFAIKDHIKRLEVYKKKSKCVE
jgi:hypothetical protein